MRRLFVVLVFLVTSIQSSTVASAQDHGCESGGCDACDNGAGSCRYDNGFCDRWFEISRSLEDSGIEFEGEVSQFYQGVSSGGLQREFRYGGHGEYNIDLDFG
jgi:hypothetical protein